MTIKDKFGVKKKGRDEWLMHQPGGRLDHWSGITEVALYKTLDSALAARRLEGAKRYAEVVRFTSDKEFSYEVAVASTGG